MNTTDKYNESFAKMSFASVYPHHVNRVEKKSTTVEYIEISLL